MRIYTAAMFTLLAGCAPTKQYLVVKDSQSEMQAIDDKCPQETQNVNQHEALVQCKFHGYDAVLRAAGFDQIGALYVYRDRVTHIAQQLDEYEISPEQAASLENSARGNFIASLKQMDDVRQRNYTNAMIAIGQGFQQAPHYTPAPPPSFSCPACMEGVQAGQANANFWQQQAPPVQSPSAFGDTYVQESQRPNPYASGVYTDGPMGYNAVTGKVDTHYVPAGADPNPPVNVFGAQTLGGN